jgi:D-alanyl-D-alanine carboxypeptidase
MPHLNFSLCNQLGKTSLSIGSYFLKRFFLFAIVSAASFLALTTHPLQAKDVGDVTGLSLPPDVMPEMLDQETSAISAAWHFRDHAAASDYAAPGPAGDPWHNYIHEAASRFNLPERWIREVMRAESGGRQHGIDGMLTTSWAGAMGLMQVMPGTYDVLRQRYHLGIDPYNPRDNILAGSAYIQEMYHRFGSLGFLAAYNAGPLRVDSYLNANTPLPAETIAYMAHIAPRLGLRSFAPYVDSVISDLTMRRIISYGPDSGPFQSVSLNIISPFNLDFRPHVITKDFNRRGLTETTGPVTSLDSAIQILTAASTARQEIMRQTRHHPRQPMEFAMSPTLSFTHATANRNGHWGIEIGRFNNQATTKIAVHNATAAMIQTSSTAQPVVSPVWNNGVTLYKVEMIGLTQDAAASTCDLMIRRGLTCMTISPGS